MGRDDRRWALRFSEVTLRRASAVGFVATSGRRYSNRAVFVDAACEAGALAV
jgi:hypothetical protein